MYQKKKKKYVDTHTISKVARKYITSFGLWHSVTTKPIMLANSSEYKFV